jgi:predicted O-methyltransferase YrrM
MIRSRKLMIEYLLHHPVEAVDRIVNALERTRHEQPPAYAADAEWERKLHALLGAAWPCPELEQFDAIWSTAMEELWPSDSPPLSHYDAGRNLVRAAWCSTRHTRPRHVVETGVGRGISTRFILEALARNGSGHLWSIDLPPLDSDMAHVGTAVPDELRIRWTYLRGSSRRRLANLLEHLGEIDLFVHDSLHTTHNVRFELNRAWAVLRPGGVILVDDAPSNAGFHRLTRQIDRSGISFIGLADRHLQPGLGIAVRTRTSHSLGEG